MFPPPLTQRNEFEYASLAERFSLSSPVRHVVIDDFLDPEVAELLYEDFPDQGAMPKSRDYLFSDKRELSTLDRHSEVSRSLHSVLTSDDFQGFLGQMAGHPVFVDPNYVGGGFHVGGRGSFLDLHTDFNLHPANPGWFRELNILIYLNPGWQPEWGGELLLTDDPKQPGIAVEPLFNRAVIMESTDRSFHGYRRLQFPDGAVCRSVAAYAYSAVPDGSVERRTTNRTPEDAGAVKTVLAKNWNRIVLTKNRFFGSSTLKNRR